MILYKMKSVYIKSSIIPLVIPNLLFRKSWLEININKSRLGITKDIILDFIWTLFILYINHDVKTQSQYFLKSVFMIHSNVHPMYMKLSRGNILTEYYIAHFANYLPIRNSIHLGYLRIGRRQCYLVIISAPLLHKKIICTPILYNFTRTKNILH